MTTNLLTVTRNHDRAVRVGRRLNAQPLDYLDLTDLFACCSDVPELVEEVQALREKIASWENTIKAARKWAIRFSKRDMGDQARHAEATDLDLLSAVQFLPEEHGG